jgi:hypothetical protein
MELLEAISNMRKINIGIFARPAAQGGPQTPILAADFGGGRWHDRES